MESAAMFGAEIVTRPKFVVPSTQKRLERPRLYQVLEEAKHLPLLVIMGGAGYGKSTLLAGYLASSGNPSSWYALSERERDPQVLAIHLAHLFHRSFPGSADRMLEKLAMPGGASVHGQAAIEALSDELFDRLQEDHWLVLDDFHLIHGALESISLLDRLIYHLPPRLHLVLSTRQRPELPNLAKWRLQGDVLFLDQDELAFRAEEIEALFLDTYGIEASSGTLDILMRRTEGWPISLQLFAQKIKKKEKTDLENFSDFRDLRDLFDYLAREVLESLSEEEREFFLVTAPLSRLEPSLCDSLREKEDSERLLRNLNDRGLFLVLEENVFRHHHLFREFLLGILSEESRREATYRKVAHLLSGLGREEEAIEHFLEAGDFEVAAGLMTTLAGKLVNQGRYARIESWLQRLPNELIDRAPALAISQGDAYRLASRFEEALLWYDRAEKSYRGGEGKSRALASKALVFLDTVQPTLAEKLLEEALIFSVEAGRRAEILVMLAENKMNQGDARGAEALFREAQSELPENLGRICLRTGRLAEGRLLLRTALLQKKEGKSKAHRETKLILSLIESMMGEPSAARELAEQTLRKAREQGSAWTEAMALIRGGHACLVLGEKERAIESYLQALSATEAIGIARLKAEPLIGLVLAAGMSEKKQEAEAFAREGMAIVRGTGDAWITALMAIAIGTAFARTKNEEAERWLLEAAEGFAHCGDTFGEALASLWLAKIAPRENFKNRHSDFSERMRKHDYGFLLKRATLFGLAEKEIARFLQAEKEEKAAKISLGLRVWTLGGFRVFRSLNEKEEEIGERAWGREKARQLFHLFLVFRQDSLPKSRIIDLLWPDLDPGNADGTFRVALNALNKALEPGRPSGKPSRFIVRKGANYGLDLASIWLDCEEFEKKLDLAQSLEASGVEDPVPHYQQALSLSEGEFLKEFPSYDSWCERERERLEDRYLESALRLARLLLSRGEDAACAAWIQRLIERAPCAEEAYRFLMLAHYRQGDRTMALRTYERCLSVLEEELDVPPMPETKKIHQQILSLVAPEEISRSFAL
ncbi:MAG TPA: hypothetical protein DD435_11780 [Cyanobacteria bacterium UBA8530]|nr:hypothetical protein [Cyanobacteria bacterium UBA8530]